MKVSRDELAAYADGRLEGDHLARVALAIATDAGLRAEVDTHRALKAKLAERTHPVLTMDAPQRQAQRLRLPSPPADDARYRSSTRLPVRMLPLWVWIAAPMLAALMVLAIVLGARAAGTGYARPDLAQVLNGRLSTDAIPAGGTRILLSFRDGTGGFCRAFSGSSRTGIACRDARGWRFQPVIEGTAQAAPRTMAEAVTAAALDMAPAGALTPEAERAALARGWRAP
ncbi:MAG: hypothetical protein B7Z39_02430 [Novosphingobium sp. 12-64-8]|nr:MAG: hypothetical protein B7Z39_02430 [Novosphingobium sp. 12-64-8]